jgi:putative colanic acid biosynthesis acetyltransferase WcaF
VTPPNFQDLSKFTVPADFRGRSRLQVQLWWLVQATLFRGSPQVLYGFRRWLLRLFGARVGAGVIVRPSATITYPWQVELGDHCWVGDDVVLYSFATIRIGSNAVVSQKSYLCAGTHDYRSEAFDLQGFPIVIGAKAWVAADVFVGPGVTIGEGAVVGSRSAVFTDLPPMMVSVGAPAKPLKPRFGA